MNTLSLGSSNVRSQTGKNILNRAGAALGVALLVGSAIPAAAQSTHRTRRESNANRKARIAHTIQETYGHRFEVAGGGGYERYRPGPYLQQNNEITFWASTLYALNPKLGIVGEVRGGYGNAKIGNLAGPNFLPYNPQISEYNFMAGPSYRIIRREKYSVSAVAEGGATLGKFAGDSKGLTAQDIGVWTGDYSAAFSVGANVDYNIFPNVALRVTPTYLGSTFNGKLQNSKGVNMGVVYRFGHIR